MPTCCTRQSCGALGSLRLSSGCCGAGEAHLVVLAHTDEAEECSVLWHVPVHVDRVAEATKFLMQLYQSEVRAPQTSDQAWTPMKRLASVVEHVSEETAMAQDDA